MENIFGKNAIMLLGTMFAALVTGFFAFMNLISSKEQKVSEFRQNWIDSLRNSIAVYISSLSYLSTLYIHHKNETKDTKTKFNMTKEVEGVYAKVNESYNDIVFRINENEKDPNGKKINNDFLEALENTRSLYNGDKLTEAREKCHFLREKTKPLLKYEWERVKSGEPNYRRAKTVSFIVLIIGLVLACFNVYLIYNCK